MWQHTGRLPHVLRPADYHAPEVYARELAVLFDRGWHCVATLDALGSPGDFVTLELLGQPVLVRNCDGELRAFQNVCAHRHSVLVSEPRGTSPRIRCQYHGWEYDADGRTCRVPDARSFVPIRRGGEGLRRFRAAACGRLVFVSLAEDGAGLREALGEPTWGLIEERFSPTHRETAAWTVDHAANWKVVVENSLEGYHLPVVHPRSLRKLSSEHSSTHVFDPRFTALENTIPPGGAAMTWVAERWVRAPARGYRHHLAYPSLMLALTDISSMVQVVVPLSPTSSRSLVFAFVHGGHGRMIPRVLAPMLGRVVNRFTQQVQREDNAMFPNIQRGLQASDHAGAIGAREERVHEFQRYVERAVSGA